VGSHKEKCPAGFLQSGIIFEATPFRSIYGYS
jgi:hypothetical protein